MISSKDFSSAFSSLGSAKGYVITIVLTLGITLGALVAVVNLNYQLLAAPLPYPQAERLVKFVSQRFDAGKIEPDRSAPYPLWFELYERPDDFFEQKALLAYTVSVERRLPDSPSLTTVATTPEFLTMVDAPMALGRKFNADEGLGATVPVAIISYSCWQSIFQGDKQVLGKTLNVMEIDFKIIGVLAEEFIEPDIHQTGLQTDLWLPIDYDDMPPPFRKRWDSSRSTTFLVGLLKPGVTRASAEQAINTLAAGRIAAETQILPGRAATSVHFDLLPFKAAIVAGAGKQSLLMLLGVGVLLLMAATTIVNLILARAATQARRHAIQVALGAQARHIFSALFAEILLLIVAAELLALGLAQGLLHSFKWLLKGQLPRLGELQLNALSLIFCMAVGLLLALVFAYLISRQINYRKLNELLQSSGKGVGLQLSARTRSSLIFAQVTFTGVLLAASLQLFIYALQELRQPLGYQIANQYAVRLSIATLWDSTTPDERRHYFYQLVESLQQNPKVVAVGMSTSPPIDHYPPYSELLLRRADTEANATPEDKLQAKRTYCDGSLLNILQIPLIAGRYFTDAEVRAGAHFILVNETLARAIQADGHVLGKLLYRPGSPEGFLIVGILRDLKIPGTVEPARFFQAAIVEGPQLIIQVQPGQQLAARDINAAAAKIHPQIKVFEIITGDEALAEFTLGHKIAASLAALISLLALCLAAIGIYGVLSYSVQLRQFELGIRMAIGARPTSIFLLLLKDSLAPVLLGLGAALLVLLAASLWLQQSPYAIPMSLGGWLLPVILVIALTAVTSLLAVWQIIRQPVVQRLRANS
jgi:putative ABC transport system permease protein